MALTNATLHEVILWLTLAGTVSLISCLGAWIDKLRRKTVPVNK